MNTNTNTERSADLRQPNYFRNRDTDIIRSDGGILGNWNSQFGSRLPKIEVTGVLVPTGKCTVTGISRFKLEACLRDYNLRMKSDLEGLAEKMAWKEVTVKGQLDPLTDVLAVEKIIVDHGNDPPKAGALAPDP